VLEESEEEPEVWCQRWCRRGGEVMVVVHMTSPSLPHGATEASSPAPRATVAVDAIARSVGEPEVVMGHPTFHALGDVALDEAVGMAH
jgi:hypothetical protein